MVFLIILPTYWTTFNVRNMPIDEPKSNSELYSETMEGFSLAVTMGQIACIRQPFETCEGRRGRYAIRTVGGSTTSLYYISNKV